MGTPEFYSSDNDDPSYELSDHEASEDKDNNDFMTNFDHYPEPPPDTVLPDAIPDAPPALPDNASPPVVISDQEISDLPSPFKFFQSVVLHDVLGLGPPLQCVLAIIIQKNFCSPKGCLSCSYVYFG